MIELHPDYIKKNGRAEFVVLPVEEFQSLRDYLEDMEDLVDLRKAKEEQGGAATVSLHELKQTLD
jgi:PHD/YefM family antitoxin component YafN of YafNO toxin-antitoxin module